MNRRPLLAFLLVSAVPTRFRADASRPHGSVSNTCSTASMPSEWLAQSRDYSPQRLRAFTTLDDIAKMHAMGFDHVRLSIDPAIFQCDGPWSQCERVQILDEVVAKALSQDLAVIIDIHPERGIQTAIG